MIVILLYLLACVVCGFMGRKTAWGFIGHFFLAVLITPLGDFLVQWAGRPSPAERERRETLERIAEQRRRH